MQHFVLVHVCDN